MGIWLYATVAFAVTAVLKLTLRPLAFRLRLTDKPGGRKHHTGEIPLVGGIAMLIGILVTAMVASGLYGGQLRSPAGHPLVSLTLPAGVDLWNVARDAITRSSTEPIY
jgi:UDP-N-acetylmuramyl pentapeptide phosphotransferase/UDP-N-acetylglucosamine-1-phosphate transferase